VYIHAEVKAVACVRPRDAVVNKKIILYPTDGRHCQKALVDYLPAIRAFAEAVLSRADLPVRRL